jgi:hypothetical protein
MAYKVREADIGIHDHDIRDLPQASIRIPSPVARKRRLDGTVRIEGRWGGVGLLRPRRSEVHLLRDRKGVINFNAEVPDGALNLGVAEQ